MGYHYHVTNKFNVCVVSNRDARSYTILMENGTHISQNRIELKCTSVQFDPRPNTSVLPKARYTISSDANSKHAPPSGPNSNVKCMGKGKLTQKGINVSNNSMYKMCSGCASKLVTD